MDPRQRLHALVTRPDGAGFRMAIDKSTRTARVDLFDEIGYFGVSAKAFVSELNRLEDVDTLDLHISSPGGDVFDGIAITNALRQHPARVVATVDGLAASAASFIVAGAADEVVMARNSELMVHDAWGMAIGNAGDMRKLADDLDRISNNIASMYADKAGGDVADWRTVMLAETWYSAEEAVAAGLADRVEPKAETDGEDAPTRASFDLSVFAHAGRSNAPAPRSPVASASGTRTTRTPEGGSAVAFSDEQLTTLRQRVGVASDADEATILAAIDEALTERADPQPSTTAVPEGMALVDAATLNALRTDAAAGREARNRQLEQERTAIVDSAVADGRIVMARKEWWLNAITVDPGMKDVLAAQPANEALPLRELGDSGTQVRNQAGSEDDTYRQLFPQEG